MQITGLKNDIKQLKNAVKSEKNQDSKKEEWWERINEERIAEGKHPVIYIDFNYQNWYISEIFYEFNLEKIDELRIQEGKFPLLPLYLAGEYQKVKEEIQKYDIYFLRKLPRSMLLEESCQPLADAFGFDNIGCYNQAEYLFMQDQNLCHLHHKPELGDEFRKYLISQWKKEGAVLDFDKEQMKINHQPAKIKAVERGMIISEKKRNYLEPIKDNHQSGDFKFIFAVQDLQFFEFVDTVAVPGQLITLRYKQTGAYKDQGIWTAEYSETGETLPVSNINLWIWIHQRSISAKIREIKEENKNV
jgi:hypothetical protein